MSDNLKQFDAVDNMRDNWETHRTSDQLGYFKIRVTLNKNRQIGAHSQNPGDDDQLNETDDGNDSATQGSNAEQEERSNSNNRTQILANDTIVREMTYLERIYSPTEVMNYRQGNPICDDANQSNNLAKKIQKEIDKDSNYRGEEIFTRTTDDKYIHPSEIDRPFKSKTGRSPTALAEAVLEEKGDQELIDILHTEMQSMHIFASLTALDGSQHEELLCIIRSYPNGRIDVRPPFSNKAKPPSRKDKQAAKKDEKPLTYYKFDMPQSGTVTYTVEVIEDKAHEESPFERTLLNDIKRRRAIFDAAQADCELAHPPESPQIRMFYRGEIATALMYEAENVAVEYTIVPPEKWYFEDATELKGCSQLADCKDTNGVAYINMPIDFVARCDSQTAPTLQVTLHSYTPNNSRIVVGYGSCQLPMTRGSHTITFDVWRVRGTVLEELKLQFLDSGLEIQPDPGATDMTNLLLRPPIEKATPINNFGLRTIGTGKVTVKFNLAMQSTLFRPKAVTQAQPPMSSLGAISARDPNSRMSLLMNSRLNVQ